MIQTSYALLVCMEKKSTFLFCCICYVSLSTFLQLIFFFAILVFLVDYFVVNELFICCSIWLCRDHPTTVIWAKKSSIFSMAKKLGIFYCFLKHYYYTEICNPDPVDRYTQ